MPLIIDGVTIEKVIDVETNEEFEYVIDTDGDVVVFESWQDHFIVKDRKVVDSKYIEFFNPNVVKATAGKGTKPPYYADTGNVKMYSVKSGFVYDIVYGQETYKNYGEATCYINGVAQDYRLSEISKMNSPISGNCRAYAVNRSSNPAWYAEAEIWIESIYIRKV